MRPYIPVLYAVTLLAACGSEDNMDFQTRGADTPLPLIEVYKPLNGSVIPANNDFAVEYEVVRGSSGAYVEIRVDKQKPMRVNSLKGQHRVPGLNPGKHTLLIVEHTASGEKTGGVARIVLTAE